MKSFRIFPAVALLVCLSFSSSAFAVIDDNASVVKIRKGSCIEAGVTLDNCFVGPGAAVTWIMNTRKPTATTPLIVEVGPGNYGILNMECESTWGGHTTFRGAGMHQTIIGNMTFDSCTDLDFSDLTVRGGTYGGIVWNGGGKSTWHNVAVEGIGQSWYSDTCGSVRGSHYWFGSRITNTAAFSLANGYSEKCDESWFFGSEITTIVPVGAYPAGGAAVAAQNQGIIHVYGSVLRVIIDGPTSATGVAAAISGGATSGAEVHIHGTGIDVISNTGANIVALSASNGGTIHADATAYNMNTTGTITRIKKDANPATHVHAPYHWQHIPSSPLISVTGADMTTETVGADINMLVYNSQCTGSGGPWYNVALRTCR